MYLKNIEIQGFKSFAHKSRFDFHNGITGIVGPNGSGKSNIADAVRWVLGEQRTRQLRGGHMQDVIFSGTETKKSLSFASVTITFNNSDHQIPLDYEEVIVTRKLFRSGESEYLINGASCRLKDIYELFYDTGIGKEGYSIIGQGQIDKILSGRPEERRELFDEAAGIVKFKRRKAESLKRLSSEEQNLARVKDILMELDKQLEPLEKQSDKAKKYLAMKEELKQNDIQMFLIDYSRIKGKKDAININFQNTLLELNTAKNDYSRKKSEYEIVESEEEVIDSLIEDYNLKLSESQILKEQLEGKVALLHEQINNIKNTDEHYQKRYEAIRKELGDKEMQMKNILIAQNGFKEDYRLQSLSENDFSRKLASIQTDIMGISSEMDAVRGKMIEVINSRADTKSTIERYSVMGQQSGIRKKEIQQAIQVTESAIENLVTTMYQKKEVLSEADNDIMAVKRLKDDADDRIKGCQEKREDLQKKFQFVQNAYIREEARLESLRELSKQYEGFGLSVKKVMELKKDNENIHGVVADVIRADKDYETAIETALGGSIQNIIVKDENTAKEAIEILKNGNYGRATFLPLQSVKRRKETWNREILREEGVIATADHLVNTDNQYREIIRSLLGSVLVVDTIHSGIKLSRKYKQSVKIVTQEGELFHVGGAISGGRHKKNSHMLGRYRELALMEEKLPSMKRDMEALHLEISQYDEKIACEEKKKEEYRLNLTRAYEYRNGIHLEYERLELKKNEENERIRDLREELENISLTLRDVQDNEEAIVEELSISEKIEADMKCRLDELGLKLESLLSDEIKYKEKCDSYMLELSKLEQKILFEEENAARVEGEIRNLSYEMKGLVHTQGDVSREIREREAQILDLETAIHNSKDLFFEIHEEILVCKKKKEDLNTRHKTVIQDRERMSGRINDLEKEIIRLENSKNNLEESERKLLDYMWDEYEMTYNQALKKQEKTENNESQIKKRISQLKEQIKKLGSVNVNAIETYKELWKRYSFLKLQHDDICKAQDALTQVILELDTAMRKRFTHHIKDISSEYNNVFKALFGGGKGTIEVLGDEDVLEADIQIIAQPPGKKLQNMMQLSGGEKALTAISLLFAIQNLKPSPFCLLDEIEAALDDNNIVRFSQYLKKLSQRTQFIVITHRRGTMNAADRLYGITMMEKGVSTQVSVSLLDHLEEK